MKPGSPLKLALAAIFCYAFITVLFLDGKKRDDSGTPPRMTEKAQSPPVPGMP